VTTPYHVVVAPAARKQIRALPPKLQKPLLKLAEALAINPRPPGSEKIDGMTGLYGEHFLHLRLIYKIEEQEILLLLVK
jgi:mRNA interferase RelE/StbE